MVHLFMSDNLKHDAATIATHRKQIMELLEKRGFLVSSISKIWENIDSCAEHYGCATVLYLLSILLQSFNIIIYRGISAQGHGREVVDSLNSMEKRFVFHLVATVQLTGSEQFDKKCH